MLQNFHIFFHILLVGEETGIVFCLFIEERDESFGHFSIKIKKCT